MRKIIHYFSLWHTLFVISLITIVGLIGIHLSEALSYSSMVLYSNHNSARIAWEPSQGEVDHYVLEITSTRFFPNSSGKSGLTQVIHVKSRTPYYNLMSEHNHSYKVRVKAVSPSGISSTFSEPSTLFICDQENPKMNIPPTPAPQRVRQPSILISGTFVEPNLSSIKIEGTAASINPADKSFSAMVALETGNNLLNISAHDLAGNTSTMDLSVNYTPLTIVSIPSDAKIYWNGNYAYSGDYSGTTPRSYNQAIIGPQVLQLTHPGFNEFYGMVDFSDLSKDVYFITLTPFAEVNFNQMTRIRAEEGEINFGTYSHPFVTDYNLDGKKDLLLGTEEGTIVLLLNSGTENVPAFSHYQLLKAESEDIDVGTSAAPFMVDYNNDGVQDLLVGNGEGSLFYFTNRGSTSEPVFTSSVALHDVEGTEIAVESYCKPFVIDWNNDNKKDILLGSGNGTLGLYLNQGSDSNPVLAASSILIENDKLLNAGDSASPYVTDWDGDGDKDLLVGNEDGFINLYLNSNAEGPPLLAKADTIQLNNQELMVDSAAVPFLVDWDSNDTKELLIGCGDGYIYLAR